MELEGRQAHLQSWRCGLNREAPPPPASEPMLLSLQIQTGGKDQPLHPFIAPSGQRFVDSLTAKHVSTYLWPHGGFKVSKAASHVNGLTLSCETKQWERLSPSCSPRSFLASSSVVAKPFTSFCLATGGGVGGREAGGVGGLLRLFCCRDRQEAM